MDITIIMLVVVIASVLVSLLSLIGVSYHKSRHRAEQSRADRYVKLFHETEKRLVEAADQNALLRRELRVLRDRYAAPD